MCRTRGRDPNRHCSRFCSRHTLLPLCKEMVKAAPDLVLGAGRAGSRRAQGRSIPTGLFQRNRAGGRGSAGNTGQVQDVYRVIDNSRVVVLMNACYMVG